MPVEASRVILVVKVGGSLLNLPDLRARLGAFLATLPLASVVLLPGGGRAADVVRDLDHCHELGDERAHWLALAALGLNAHFLEAIIHDAKVAKDLAACEA